MTIFYFKRLNAMDFNTNTLYLNYPPSIKHVEFNEFKNKYRNFTMKIDTINKLLIFCQKLRNQNIIPYYLILGGSYLKNTDSSNSILKIIGCFKSNALPNTTAIKKYFSPIGESAVNLRSKKDDELKLVGLQPVNWITLSSNETNLEALSHFNEIRDLQTDHTLENKLYKVGLICLSFNEVISNVQ
ncbi:hypothetical protein ACT54I_05235 [Leptospira interrogans]